MHCISRETRPLSENARSLLRPTYANLAGLGSLLAFASRSYRTILMYLGVYVSDTFVKVILLDDWGKQLT